MYVHLESNLLAVLKNKRTLPVCPREGRKAISALALICTKRVVNTKKSYIILTVVSAFRTLYLQHLHLQGPARVLMQQEHPLHGHPVQHGHHMCVPGSQT